MFDVTTPIPHNLSSRDEIFLVPFEGFIKNTTEGLIRTMLREPEEYLDRYPGLKEYDDTDMDIVYLKTNLYRPKEILRDMSNQRLDETIIEKDYQSIMEEVYFPGNHTTAFEVSLTKLLYEKNVKYCVIWKEEPFFDYELSFLIQRFASLRGKIDIQEEVDFAELAHVTEATTIFTYDPGYVFDYVPKRVPPSERDDRMYVILHSWQTCLFSDGPNGESLVEVDPEFVKMVEKANEDNPYLVTFMENKCIPIL